MEKTPITLDNLNASNLPELAGWKEKQTELVKDNPFIEIVDNKSFEIAKQRRTALLKGRTSIEAQDKLIASKLTNFRKDVKSISDELISITLPHEEKQQNEVKRYEQIKENERLEKERLENERIERIKNKVSEFESLCYDIIQKSTIENINDNKSKLDVLFNTDFDFEEYEILFDQAKERIQSQFDVKCSDIQEKENQRIENERLAREKAESDAKLKAMEEEREKERKERETKEREEKEKVFEIRKNRLFEIGFGFDFVENNFIHTHLFSGISRESIFECDVIDFENIISDAKKAIQEAKDLIEKEEKEKAEKEASELQAKKQAEKENKERQKRLKKEKEQLIKSIGTIKDSFISEIVFREFENTETETLRSEFKKSFDLFFDECLNKIENL